MAARPRDLASLCVVSPGAAGHLMLSQNNHLPGLREPTRFEAIEVDARPHPAPVVVEAVPCDRPVARGLNWLFDLCNPLTTDIVDGDYDGRRFL
jgi:hypothetical protein